MMLDDVEYIAQYICGAFCVFRMSSDELRLVNESVQSVNETVWSMNTHTHTQNLYKSDLYI